VGALLAQASPQLNPAPASASNQAAPPIWKKSRVRERRVQAERIERRLRDTPGSIVYRGLMQANKQQIRALEGRLRRTRAGDLSRLAMKYDTKFAPGVFAFKAFESGFSVKEIALAVLSQRDPARRVLRQLGEVFAGRPRLLLLISETASTYSGFLGMKLKPAALKAAIERGCRRACLANNQRETPDDQPELAATLLAAPTSITSSASSGSGSGGSRPISPTN
jgi:hypothetical protein